jgi:type I restriction enzyme S subunit
MRALPNNWIEVLLGEIASTTSGIGFPKHYQGETTGDSGFYKVGDISKAVLEYNGHLSNPGHYVSYEIAEKLRGNPIPVGATVFAKIGEAIKLNRRAIVKTECLVDNNVMAVKAKFVKRL